MGVAINGKNYEAGNIQVTLPTGIIVMLESISYKDKIEGEAITNWNGVPVDYAQGEYSGTCDMEVHRNEFAKIVLASTQPGFFNGVAMPVVVTMNRVGMVPQVDTFAVKWTERELSAKKGDKSLLVPLSGIIIGVIVTNGTPAFIGNGLGV